jgi:hypothetical protein
MLACLQEGYAMPDTSLDDPNLSIADLLARWPRGCDCLRTVPHGLSGLPK